VQFYTNCCAELIGLILTYKDCTSTGENKKRARLRPKTRHSNQSKLKIIRKKERKRKYNERKRIR